MSARECLVHPWMKKNIVRPNSSVKIQSPEKRAAPMPVIRAESSPSVIISTPDLEVEKSNKSKQDQVENESDASPTSDELTNPTVQVIGRPPLHPRISQKSMSLSSETGTQVNVSDIGVQALPATTPFLNKELRMGSRQNLNKLRTMSKSREVLSERIQMSNLKKTLSKSRERLYDPRLGLTTSRNDLLNCQSLSQSVEALTALSQLHQNGALYKSCNNIFIPMVKPNVKFTSIQDRMYKSLASIDKIPGNDLTKNVGYFESRFTVDDDYNDIITRRNTNLNTVIRDSFSGETMRLMGAEDGKLGGLRGNPCRGGRGAEGSDRACSRHTHRHPEAQSTQKINKMSRADRMKKDAQRRRKERKERELNEKERHRKYSLGEHEYNRNAKQNDKTHEGSTSPTMRRGSVCHVEQRLQERHERLLEKQEREGRKTSSIRSRRLSSIDCDRSPVGERQVKSSPSKSSRLVVSDERPRSITPNRKNKSKIDSPQSSDVSQASSMESVIGSLENIQTRLPETRNKTKLCSNTRSNNRSGNANSDFNDNIVEEVTDEKSSSFTANRSEIQKDSDEAYISLEEGSKETISIESKSDDGESTASDKTFTESLTDGQITPINLVDSQSNSSNEHIEDDLTIDTCKLNDTSSTVTESASDIESVTILLEDRALSPVEEESEDRKYVRSTSATSDLGSTISEESEESSDNVNFNIDTKIFESKTRLRSYSVQHKSDQFLNIPKVRTRSNSVHQGSNDKARPWGGVCSGSVAKALKNFTIQEDNSVPDIQKRRLSSPPLSSRHDSTI